MHLSKSQRHTAYIIMRAELKEGYDFNNCLIFISGLSLLSTPLVELEVRLARHVFIQRNGVGHATRLRILDECIKETY